jgi:hypothetical protein
MTLLITGSKKLSTQTKLSSLIHLLINNYCNLHAQLTITYPTSSANNHTLYLPSANSLTISSSNHIKKDSILTKTTTSQPTGHNYQPPISNPSHSTSSTFSQCAIKSPTSPGNTTPKSSNKCLMDNNS